MRRTRRARHLPPPKKQALCGAPAGADTRVRCPAVDRRMRTRGGVSYGECAKLLREPRPPRAGGRRDRPARSRACGKAGSRRSMRPRDARNWRAGPGEAREIGNAPEGGGRPGSPGLWRQESDWTRKSGRRKGFSGSTNGRRSAQVAGACPEEEVEPGAGKTASDLCGPRAENQIHQRRNAVGQARGTARVARGGARDSGDTGGESGERGKTNET